MCGSRKFSGLKHGFLVQIVVAEHRPSHSDMKEVQKRMADTRHDGSYQTLKRDG